MIRLTDIVVSGLALIGLLPIFILTSILLRFTGEGEVLFLQKRIGRGGEPFFLIKFATMIKGSHLIGPGEVTFFNDARVLPVGRFLRKSKINEMPQLINVLKGDMSLIGHRPQTEKYWNCFTKSQRKALAKNKPGLSGMSSILLRDEEAYLAAFSDPVFADEKLLMPFKGRVEEWYSENASYINYIKLITLTLIKVFAHRSTHYIVLNKKMSHFQTELNEILEKHS